MSIQVNLNQMRKLPKKQGGFTMLELIMVLVVIAVLSAVIMGVYVRASASSDSNKMETDLQTIEQGVRSIYSNQEDGYASLTMQTLVGAKVFPSDLQIKGTDSVFSQFGYPITVQPSTVSANQNFFDITYSKVPYEVCNKLLGSLNKEMFTAISVGTGNVIYNDGSDGLGQSKPWPNAATIQTACGSSPVDMTFTTH